MKLVLCIGCMAHAPFAVPSLFRDNIVRGGGLRGRYSVSVCVHGMKGGGAFCCASLHPLPLACIHTTALVQCPPSSESITGEWWRGKSRACLTHSDPHNKLHSYSGHLLAAREVQRLQPRTALGHSRHPRVGHLPAVEEAQLLQPSETLQAAETAVCCAS